MPIAKTINVFTVVHCGYLHLATASNETDVAIAIEGINSRVRIIRRVTEQLVKCCNGKIEERLPAEVESVSGSL